MQLMSSNLQAMLVLDREHRVVRANSASAALFDTTISGFIGRSFDYTVTDGAIIETNTRRLRVQLLDSSEYTYVVLHDLTLQHSPSTHHYLYLFMSAVDSIAEGVAIFSTASAQQARIIYINPAMSKLTGCSSDDLHDQPPHVLLGSQTSEDDRAALCHTLTHGLPMSRQMINYRRDGTPYHVSVTVSPIHDAEGRVTHFVSVHRDITQTVQAQQRHLEAEKLRVESERHREMLELRDRFISTIAHELRNPLSVIFTSCDLILKYHTRMTQEKVMGKVSMIAMEARNLSDMLDDAVTVSQEGLRDTDPVYTTVELVSLCLDLINENRSVDEGQHARYEKPRHQFLFSSPGATLTMRTDARLLRHVLKSLLQNAVRYSPRGGDIRLILELEGDNLIFEITDQGMGIPVEDQPYVFEPFFRGSNALEISGSGLGLSIARNYARAMHGDIELSSEPGSGTVVRFQLPLKV